MSQRGFSLLETMVALSVFSVAAMGLLSLNTQSVRISSELDTRLIARTVAENVAVDTVTSSFENSNLVSTGEQIQRGRIYAWRRTIEATPRPDLFSIRIEVTEGESPVVLARLSLLATESAPP
ncbi:MAG: type II secretion system minor pseudopilin GspI [Hyphomonas sp.]